MFDLYSPTDRDRNCPIIWIAWKPVPRCWYNSSERHCPCPFLSADARVAVGIAWAEQSRAEMEIPPAGLVRGADL